MLPIDRPLNLSIKDFLVRKVSVKSMINEKTVLDIINFQFQDGLRAIKEHKEVELTGFGKFLFKDKRALKHRETLLSMQRGLKNQPPTPLIEKKLAQIQEHLNYIDSKITHEKTVSDQSSSDSGGMEK